MMKAARGLDLVSCPTARTRQLADLPEEMIMEILLRLPARTLVSLKSVCTSWRNLISSPDFARNHLRRSCLRDPTVAPPRIAYYNESLRWPDDGYDGIGVVSVQSIMDNPSEPTQVDYFTGQHYNKIVGSCHGLLCLLQEDAGQNMHAILWNPCTGFTFQSPQISGQDCRRCGFGYDHLSDSYKLFGIIEKEVSFDLEYSTRMYTFGPTSSWRRIDGIPFGLFGDPIYHPFVADNEEGVFFDSNRACTINWSLPHHHVVLYFDLGKETHGHFPLLPDMDLDDYPHRQNTHLCVLRNFFSVCYEQHRRTPEWIVWQMKEYGDAQSWTKLAVIPLHPKFTYSDTYHHHLRPFYISESNVLLTFSLSVIIILCNLNDGSVDFPKIDGSRFPCHPFSFCPRYRVACIYHESLISPNGLQSNSSKMLLRLVKPKPKSIVSW